MAYGGKQDCSTLLELGIKFCIVGDELKNKKNLIDAVNHFSLPIVYSKNGYEFINKGAEFTTIYILNEFEGDTFQKLQKLGQRILGPTTVIQCAKKNIALRNNFRPLYTASMKNLIISFTGFRIKEEVTEMVRLIHYMGGNIRRDLEESKHTHLISTISAKYGEKYKYAVNFGIPIMSADWIFQVWSRRHDVNCRATDKDLMKYKLLPFVGNKLAFLGFQDKDVEHMIDVTLKNGGEVVDIDDDSCTHIIVENGHFIDLNSYDIFVLKTEFFWTCIQMEGKVEEECYRYENPNITISQLHIVPTRGNKRKRLENVAHQLAIEGLQENENYSPDIKKKDFGRPSLDLKELLSKSMDISIEELEIEKQLNLSGDLRSLTPRQQVCFELYQTERNYVGILETIIKIFKEPLEKTTGYEAPLLDAQEVKIVFGEILPIHETHKKIRKELEIMIHNWNDNHSIGNVIMNHVTDLKKYYQPFINNFEGTRNFLINCDATKPRFHAFLKRCQSKPECGRQTLEELLIRPVQRLPSILLLLNDILKHTPKNSFDYLRLQRAIDGLKAVLTNINEGKRKAEGQVEMFEIVNDIYNCPANLLSSHRNLVNKYDAIEISDMLTKKSETTTWFLFNDVLEICKKRSRVINNSKTNISGFSSLRHQRHNTKAYKHLKLIPLSHIKRVVDVEETEECKNVFAIVVWSNEELKENMYIFMLLDEVDKNVFLRTLCRHVANSVCKTEAENYLTSLEPEKLEIHGSLSGNILAKLLNKTKHKLERALSMRKSPSTRGLSRTVSTIISPFKNLGTTTDSFSTLRLSSVTNLSELGSTFPCVTPTNKSKGQASSLGPFFSAKR